MKKLLSLIVSLSLLMTLTACGGTASGQTGSEGGDGPEFVLKIGHDQSEAHPYENFAQAFKSYVEENSDGRIQVDIYNSAVLGSETEMTEGLRLGTLDFLISTTSNSSSLIPEIGILGMPFLYRSDEHALAVCNDPDILTYWQDVVENSGTNITLLNIAVSGWRNLYSSVPLHSLDDLQGLKLRCQPAEIETNMWKTLGANPINMSFGEIYTSFETNLISAAENCATSYYTHLCLPVHFEHFTQEYIDSLEYDADLKQLWPMVQAHFRESNVNLLRDPVGVTCVAQAVNGGIAIDTRAMSTIPGLFAAGETASGPHGADRLGGNMMGTCQVFGAIAGREAALFAQHNRCFTLDKDDIRHTEKMQSVLYADINSSRMIVQLQNAAQKNLFICRTQERLDRMQTEIDSEMQQVLTAAHRDTPNQENLRLYHLLNTAQLMTTAANRRKESRGSHYREDFPETNPRYAAPISLCKNDIHY